MRGIFQISDVKGYVYIYLYIIVGVFYLDCVLVLYLYKKIYFFIKFIV